MSVKKKMWFFFLFSPMYMSTVVPFYSNSAAEWVEKKKNPQIIQWFSS